MRRWHFVPGGRFLYYAGRPVKFFNNCYLLKALEDTREDWADVSWKHERCLTTGGGTGCDYSVYRGRGSTLGRSGGVASGPISKMEITNEQGRRLIQGGSRRSALYASLRWSHPDVDDFLRAKDWNSLVVAGTDGKTIADLKAADFNYPAPLDLTNISVNYDTEWLRGYWRTGDPGDVFRANVRQALSTGEPGFSFNVFDREAETLRNACTEIVSSDDSDACMIGSINLAAIDTLDQLEEATDLGTRFLLHGTTVADLPYDKVAQVREKNRRVGLGLMGVHEWLVKRGYRYEMVDELRRWLEVYRGVSDAVATSAARELSLARPAGVRAIAPTGTIGILAGTTTGIEPLFAVAYKRRYLKGARWHYQLVVDSVAKSLIEDTGAKPDDLECALDLAKDYERRIKFQADVQDYVDQGISSTINLPRWGTESNDEAGVTKFAYTLARYAHRLRGFTCYPDGARGGQPLVRVDYADAVGRDGEAHEEAADVCEISGRGGSCGV